MLNRRLSRIHHLATYTRGNMYRFQFSQFLLINNDFHMCLKFIPTISAFRLARTDLTTLKSQVRNHGNVPTIRIQGAGERLE